jgi:hypothetical protein
MATTPSSKTNTVCMFDEIYNNATEVLSIKNKDIVKRSVKRKYQSAYDDCTRQIDESNTKLLQAKCDIESFDPAIVVQLKETISRLEKGQEDLKADYFEMFNEKLDIE